MGGQNHRRLTAAILALLMAACVSAQEKSGQKDSLIRLMKASSLHLEEEMGVNYRKAYDATFLHNGTYLICDTANWNVDFKVINAFGHVQILQDETSLTSDKLDYYIDEDLAEFRGGVVELRNKDNNVLRTRHLDYNTRDSVAVFKNGGAMRGKDGQVIESREGTYDSRIKVFTFDGNVNMYTDTTFVKTEGMKYDSGHSRVIFTHYVDFWNDENMLSANSGWYDRNTETFFFNGKVHATSKDQEAWSDTIYVFRPQSEVLMLGRAQVQDSLHHSAALADYILYQDTVSTVTLRKNAAVALITDPDTAQEDTIYMGADTLIYQSVRKCDIDPSEITNAEERIKNIHVDPVTEYRERAAKAAADAAAKAAEEAASKDPNKRAKAGIQQAGDLASAPGPEEDKPADADAPEEPQAPEDAPADSLSQVLDSLALQGPPDTTKIGFVTGISDVKIFRKDIQVHCNLMLYNDLDSIARFYQEPVVWNEGNRQYSSDSLFVLISNGTVDRANLLSNAFIITQEDSLYFDQIKGTEVMAYFDSTAALRRFDALGGSNAMFFLKENDHLATVNMVSSKMLSALLNNGEVEQVFYFDAPNNDAYPVAQLPADMRRMKGFNWQNELRPKGRKDITTLKMRASERASYASHPRTVFNQTDIYFPGYMDDLYHMLAVRDSIRALPKPDPEVSADETVLPATDSTTLQSETAVDSIVTAIDSLEIPSVAADSLSVQLDSLPMQSDSLGEDIQPVEEHLDSVAVQDTAIVIPLDPKAQEKAIKKAERDSTYAAKDSIRNARWAYLDSLDAAKQKAKEDKALEKKRAKTRKQLIAKKKREEREQRRLERYIRRYEKQKAKKKR